MAAKKSDPKPDESHFVRKVAIRFLDSEDQGLLDRQSRMANKLGNLLIEEIFSVFWQLRHGYFYGIMSEEKEASLLRSIYNAYEFRNKVVKIKEKHPFLKGVHSSVLKNAALNVHQALINHREGRAKMVRFKSWKRNWTSLEYEEKGKGWKVLKQKDGSCLLKIAFGKNEAGKLQWITVALDGNAHRLHLARNCRIVKDGGKYCAVFGFKEEPKKVKVPRHHKKVVYLDPNIKNFAYGLDLEGKAFEIANPSKALERQIDRVKAKRDRCAKHTIWIDEVNADGKVFTRFRSSRRYYKLDQAAKRLQEKLRESRKHFTYSAINELFSRYDEVAIGDYVPPACDHGKGRRMNRAMNGRALHGLFKTALLAGAAKRGKKASVVDERGTTRTCHACLHVVAGGISPSVRAWQCPCCGTAHLRDENSCQNGLRVCGESQGPSRNLHLPRSGHPIAVSSRCDWKFLPQGGFEVGPERAASNAKVTTGSAPRAAPMASGVLAGCAPVTKSAVH